MTEQLDIDELERIANEATPGPWAFASAPADGSDETAAEYLASSLTNDGPLFVVWVPATEGDSDGYRLTAVTGDGPHASLDAEFIAACRTAVPALIAELREARIQAKQHRRERDTALAALHRAQNGGRDRERNLDIEAIERVRALHQKEPEGLLTVCAHCRDASENATEWPCETIQALNEGRGEADEQ